MESSSKWETISAFVCVAALVAIAVAVQLLPSDAMASSSEPSPKLSNLAVQWSESPQLRKVAGNPSFKRATSDNQLLMIRGFLDKWTPKRYHELSRMEKDKAVLLTLNKLRSTKTKG